MIRHASLKDCRDIYLINSDNFSHPWTYQQIEDELIKQNAFQLVYEETKRIIGYLFASQVDYELEIITLAVQKSHQRKGIASLLLDELLTHAKKNSTIFLDVSAENNAAILFYLSHNFQEISKRKSYYRDRSDAIIMKRTC